MGGSEFQCPFGHSGILTYMACKPYAHLYGRTFQCPFGHSGILTVYPFIQYVHDGSSFNALSGIRGF